MVARPKPKKRNFLPGPYIYFGQAGRRYWSKRAKRPNSGLQPKPRLGQEVQMGPFWKEDNSLQCQMFTNNNFRVALEMPKALAVPSCVTYWHPALQQKQSFLCPGGLASFHSTCSSMECLLPIPWTFGALEPGFSSTNYAI